MAGGYILCPKWTKDNRTPDQCEPRVCKFCVNTQRAEETTIEQLQVNDYTFELQKTKGSTFKIARLKGL